MSEISNSDRPGKTVMPRLTEAQIAEIEQALLKIQNLDTPVSIDGYVLPASAAIFREAMRARGEEHRLRIELDELRVKYESIRDVRSFSAFLNHIKT